MKKIFFIFAMFILMTLLSASYSQQIMKDLNKNVIRLHILAQSNSEYDQKIKLEVRNEILKAVKNIDIKNSSEFLFTAQNTANRYLSDNNISYRAKALKGKFYFPQKTYNNIVLPSGVYNGIRIVLGDGNGENWWCIMYPPLCVTESGELNTDKNTELKLKDSLSSDTYELITNDSKKIKIKFKTVEFFNKLIEQS
jgi:stage II sporulation protein R